MIPPAVSPARSIVIVGSGGREHALARRLSEDPAPARVVVLPGNDGIARTFPCIRPERRDSIAIADACAHQRPDLVVVGPESFLADGLADRLSERGLAVLGPGAAAARLESSKWFAKDIMREANVVTAEARMFETTEFLAAGLDAFGPPWVLKADGLTGGKGVLVTRERDAALDFAEQCLSGSRFSGAGRRIVLERFLEGEELSIMAVCDGSRAVLLPAARDFKRAYALDSGPNTGGMGAIAPVAGWGAAGDAWVVEHIVEPVLAVLARRGMPYRGVLYCGLMLTQGGPAVVEFNVRFGDPETQAILPRLGGSLFDLLHGAATGDLGEARAIARPGSTVAVALVDTHYPAAHTGDGLLAGTEQLDGDAHTWMLYGGVSQGAGGWRVLGGRAAYVCADGESLDAARQRAYDGVARLTGSGWRFRDDIGNLRDAPITSSGLRG